MHFLGSNLTPINRIIYIYINFQLGVWSWLYDYCCCCGDLKWFMNEQNGKYILVSHQRRRRGDLFQLQPGLLIVLFLFGCCCWPWPIIRQLASSRWEPRLIQFTIYILLTRRPALPNYCVSFHSNRKNGGRKVLGVFVRKEKCNMRCPLDGGSRQIWRLLEFLKINLWKMKMEIDIYWENLKLAPMRQNVLQNFPFTDNFVLNINFIYALPRKF